ncbi:MAG: hypothetical protein HC845_14630 [Akkermansiaceae bacterium]|nr:hypothetical protein [Akkermansiaceae bacterium]
MKTAFAPIFGYLRIAAILSVALSLINCEKNHADIGWLEFEQDRIELNTRLELRKLKYDRAPSLSSGNELLAVNERIERQNSIITDLNHKKRTLSEDLVELEKQLPSFKIATVQQQRQAVVGLTFSEISTKSHSKYQDVSVTSIDDRGVTVHHAHGIARLRIEELKPEQQYFFGLDLDLAEEAEKKERLALASYEASLREYTLKKQAADKKAAITKPREKLASRKRQILVAAQEPSLEKRSTLSAPPPRIRLPRESYSRRTRRSSSIYYPTNYNNSQFNSNRGNAANATSCSSCP